LYDLIVKGGLVVDPAYGLNEEKDIAITDGRVSAVEAQILESEARRVVDARGLIVTPGLVDIHTHTAQGLVRLSVDPDQACLVKGSTTVVDAGSTGELNYSAFRRFIIENAKTRILAFINIESLGMVEFMDSPPAYSDQRWSELLSVSDEAYAPFFINMDNTISVIETNRDSIIGIKWAHHGLKVLELAREAADRAGCLLMVENVHTPDSLRYVKKGDIVTHLYLPITDQAGKPNFDVICPELLDVAKRGVSLDLGHGKSSFSWKIAELGMKEGLKPNTISTDLWVGNLHGPVFDIPTTMAKLIHLGMSIEEVVEASTASPAATIGRLGEIGTLRPGARADIALFRLQNGKFPLPDCYGENRVASLKLTTVNVIQEGRIVI